MNLFKSSLFVFALFVSLVFSFNTSLAATQVSETAVSPSPNGIVLANIDFRDGRIISQENNTFHLYFSLKNNGDMQTGIRYGVKLLSNTKTPYVVDEKVYDESITLANGADAKREITYTVPAHIGGEYTLVLNSESETRLPFGMINLGKVKITASQKGFDILPESCFLQVTGEKGSPHYTLLQNVDISNSETLTLTCSGVNNTDQALSMTPFFETRYLSAYGVMAPQVGGDYTAVAFARGQKKTFTVSLPKGDLSKFYSLKFQLMSGDVASNTVSIGYILRGVNATIYKVSLDKDYYKIGEKAELSLIWSGPSQKFERGGAVTGMSPAVSLSVDITSDGGKKCGSLAEQVLTKNATLENKFTIPMKLTCRNPQVKATLTDSEGTIIDQKDFAFTTVSVPLAKPLNAVSIILIIALVALVIGAFYIIKRKKNHGTM